MPKIKIEKSVKNLNVDLTEGEYLEIAKKLVSIGYTFDEYLRVSSCLKEGGLFIGIPTSKEFIKKLQDINFL
jgi:hypothetical protein